MTLPPGDTPFVRTVRLADLRADPPSSISATVIRGLPASRLRGVETLWKPAREALATARLGNGQILENAHWDWGRKVQRVEGRELVVSAVECEGEPQGLIAIAARPRRSVLATSATILYVDYLETAPWNLLSPAGRPRFSGVGSVLIAESVRYSIDQGSDGRIGLHSLPQSERFYEAHCRMRRVGPDPDYYGLVYFEYPEGEAAAWLAAARGTR